MSSIKISFGLCLGFTALCFCNHKGELRESAIDKDRKRGCVSTRELNWVGSVSNTGVFDPDDDFLELLNRDCSKPVDLTGWLLVMEGAEERTFIVPPPRAGEDNIILPSKVRVLITKENGAFQKNEANKYFPIVMPKMRFPERNFTIETRTAENFLIENAFNNPDGEPLAGGYDGYAVRSMERTDDNFDEEGSLLTSWHSYTPCNEASPSRALGPLLGTGCENGGIGETGVNVHENYNQRTFASPGEENVPQYK